MRTWKRPSLSRLYVLIALVFLSPVAGAEEVSKTKTEKEVESGSESDTTFDPFMLKHYNIPPELAEQLSRAPRFTAGSQQVFLYVNGENRGSTTVRFNDQGALCFNRTLLKHAGLRVPDDMKSPIHPEDVVLPDVTHSSSPVTTEDKGKTDGNNQNDGAKSGVTSGLDAPLSFWAGAPGVQQETSTQESSCIDFLATWSRTEIELLPARQEVRLIVPNEALALEEKDLASYQSGGAALVLNYDALAMNSSTSGSSSEYRSLSTETGLNIGDWVLRNRHNLTEQDGERNSDNLQTYLQRTVVPWKSVLQLGEIDIANPVLAGVPITGIQLLPDGALNATRSGVTIQGLAMTPQSRVEVKQEGILIHSTVVPAGPFTLQDVVLLRGNTGVDVTVYGSDGSENSFSIPAAALRQVSLSRQGTTFGAGQIRQTGNTVTQTPAVLSWSNDVLLTARHLLTGGVMLSEDWQGAGLTLDSAIGQTTISTGTTVTKAEDEGKNGMQGSVAISGLLAERLSGNLAVIWQSDGYRDLSDTLQMHRRREEDGEEDEQGRGRTQITAGLGLNMENFGSGSMAYTQSRSSTGEWGKSLSLSWSRRLGPATLSATYQKEIEGNFGDALFINLSLPVGRGKSLQTRVSRSGDSDPRASVIWNQTVSEAFNYSLSTSATQGQGEGNFSGSLSAVPYYARLNMGYSRNGGDNSSNAGLSGGLVVHRDGVTLSPNRVQDTFGIVKLGDEAGVKIRTPGGTVWTDATGRAVASQLPAWQESRLEVETATLPRNMDIGNGYQKVGAARGSVSRIDFDVIRVRRILMTAKLPDGTLLPKGASVFDESGNWVTMVVDDGQIFVADARDGKLKVSMPDGKNCTVPVTSGEEMATEDYFEKSDVVCVPG
ncbi:fimbria/pilus outer membrane usher protein [Enterobacter kobei]|nr:fimbria/pilus outer membrane usher protein [Enterobacter kobei]